MVARVALERTGHVVGLDVAGHVVLPRVGVRAERAGRHPAPNFDVLAHETVQLGQARDKH